MSKKFKVWLDSGANHQSSYEQFITLDEVGLSDEDWEDMDEDEREDVMREIAFSRSEWGFGEIEEE